MATMNLDSDPRPYPLELALTHLYQLLDLFFALAALFLLVQRQRLMAAKHRNILASRIGRGASRA